MLVVGVKELSLTGAVFVTTGATDEDDITVLEEGLTEEAEGVAAAGAGAPGLVGAAPTVAAIRS